MSYSFNVSGDTKAEVKQKISDSFDATVASQPSHAADKAAAVAAAHAFVDLLTDPADGHHFTASMHGSLGWSHADTSKFTGAGVSVSVSIQPKPKSAA